MGRQDETTLRLEHTDATALPTALGRFELIGQLGSGAMGLVLEARDPLLDRRVAIKLLHSSLWSDTARVKARLAGEAQAMAKLSHPNVVVVYEVGWFGDRAFLAMEHVEGGTLREWQQRTHSWREIVAMYLAAGEGLAAAHLEGLTHRDFKPDNVLVGRDGRPRVSDFGLANEMLEEADPKRAVDLTSSVSVGGRAAGTPAYMAPESWSGECDPRGDQFSFCVALWEALAGRRPFVANELRTLRSMIANAEIDPSGVERLPRRLELALRRGLSTAPDKRWPSMKHLLAELRTIATQRSRTPWIVGGLAVVGGAVGGVVWLRDDPAVPAESPPAASTVQVRHSSPVALTSTGGCSFMPAFLDDTTVAFDLAKAGVWDLYEVSLGRALRRLTTDEGSEWAAARGRTSNQILFLVGGTGRKPEIDLLDRNSGKRTKLYDGSGYVAWAGDGFFVTRPTSNEIHRVRGSSDEVFANIGDAGVAVNLASSPDGSRLGVFGYQRGLATLCSIEIQTKSVSCRPDLNGTPEQPMAARMAFSANSHELYYAGATGIYRIPVEGGRPERVLDAKARGGLAISPSGHSLVYSECRTRFGIESVDGVVRHTDASWPALTSRGAKAYIRNQRTIVVEQPDGARRELHTSKDGVLSELSFAADNVLVYQVGGGKQDGIYEMNIESALPNRLSAEKADVGPVGVENAIIFTRTGTSNEPHLVSVEPAGGPARVFAERTRIALASLPDGRVLVTTPARDRFYWWDPKRDVESAGPHLVLDKAIKFVRSSPNGRWLVALAAANGRLVYRLRVEPNARPELVRELTSDLGCSSAAIDNDGNVLATIDRMSGELFMVPATDGRRW